MVLTRAQIQESIEAQRLSSLNNLSMLQPTSVRDQQTNAGRAPAGELPEVIPGPSNPTNMAGAIPGAIPKPSQTVDTVTIEDNGPDEDTVDIFGDPYTPPQQQPKYAKWKKYIINYLLWLHWLLTEEALSEDGIDI